MSNAIRKMQRDKARGGGKRQRTKPRGEARQPPAPPKSPPRQMSKGVLPDVDLETALTKANPSCKRCYGTGWAGTVVKGGKKTKLVCVCVSRAIDGDAPWLKRMEREAG